MENAKTSRREERDMEEVVKWGLEKGALMHGIRAARVDQGQRGIVAVENVGKGQVILSVPRAILMSVETARLDPAIRRMEEQVSLTSQQVLAIHLLQESAKGKQSAWFPYLKQLPRGYTLLSHFLHKESIEMQDVHGIDRCMKCRNVERENWQQVRPCLEALIANTKLRSFQAWLWATATLDSRTMFIPNDRAGVLTPIGDLFNYAPPPPPYLRKPEEVLNIVIGAEENDRGADQEKDAGYGTYNTHNNQYQIITCAEYTKHEQIFLCYGRYTNLELLQSYGFMMEDNKHDQHLFSDGDLHDCFKREDVPSKNLAVLANGCPSWNLIILLRAQVLRHNKIPGVDRQILLSGASISRESDILAFEKYVEICRRKLKKYSTTLDEDHELVKLASTEKTKLAIMWRMHQKRLLTKGAHFGIKCLHLLFD